MCELSNNKPNLKHCSKYNIDQDLIYVNLYLRSGIMVERNWKHEHLKKNSIKRTANGVDNSSELNVCKHFVYFSFLTARSVL